MRVNVHEGHKGQSLITADVLLHASPFLVEEFLAEPQLLNSASPANQLSLEVPVFAP